MVDARAETGHTPLHGALMKNHSRLVELLIGYGADPTIADGDNDTSLHVALSNENMEHPSDDTPELNKVVYSFLIIIGSLILDYTLYASKLNSI